MIHILGMNYYQRLKCLIPELFLQRCKVVRARECSSSFQENMVREGLVWFGVVWFGKVWQGFVLPRIYSKEVKKNGKNRI